MSENSIFFIGPFKAYHFDGRLKKYIILLLCLFTASLMEAQIISTQFGDIEGENNGSVYQFLGIPFAKPPVNELRWKAPQNPANWEGILATKDFAPVCPQKRFEQGDTTFTLEGNEDCLYLNIWTPQISKGNLPVLLFIHGGGNQQGGASQITAGTQIFDGKNLSERGNAVIVTIQYRLGPLGFLVHPGLESENSDNTSGNYAVLDQILALKWVQNNISNFGGDPSKVMIFGESAGGVNVGNLLTTPLAAGLFSRACIQSAIPAMGSYPEARNKGIAYVDKFADEGTETQKIVNLRSLSSDSLLFFETSPIQNGVVMQSWQPVIDKIVFNDSPSNIFQSGNFNKVALIIGSNADEMSLSAPKTVTPLMTTALINTMVPAELQEEAHSLYPSGSTNTEARESFVAALSDAQFTATTRRAARCINLNQTQAVWRYLFSHRHTLSALEPFGSYHGMELLYVFNNWENAILGSGGLFKAADDSVQNLMLQYWRNFADNGNPNGANLETWPKFDSNADCYLEIKATPDGTLCGLRSEKSDLWDRAIGYSECTTSLISDEFVFSEEIRAFPNPTNGIVNILMPDDFKIQALRIVGLSGQLIYSSSKTDILDLSSLPNGMYIIEIESLSLVYKLKIIKTD